MNIEEVSSKLEGKNIVESLKIIANVFPGKLVFTTSFGVEDQVITDLIFTNSIDIEVVTLDTGRLFEETYKVYHKTIEKYKKTIRAYFPDNQEVERLLSQKGPLSFYESIENRKECCNIRKVMPLNRALKGKECWITGIRREQSENRTGMSHLEMDTARNILKFHPVFEWSLKEVEDYLSLNNVPYNELHHKGFVSIGCAPCTRAIQAGDDFRAGRWWWENNTGKECGLHEK